ncbi:hypothetical protein VW29_16270 [Devosia limi DSM 17137]|nr:polysaccharide pyruvyl transferase family protein [Devosia limi]KKB82376.1 hypothetical protein VW29_16270 [Devosia limi DSM 17137]
MPYPTVALSYWVPDGPEKPVNFGDELSRSIVELMLARRGATLLDSAPAQRQLLSIGSVLHMAREGATIWGTGLHGTMSACEHRYRSLDIRAVRGPVTQRFLRQRGIDAPSVFGDPALLLPVLTGKRFTPSGEHAVGFVPNLHDMEFLRTSGMRERHPDIVVIDPLRSWNTVVSEIARCQLIIASSLHGLVTAEALGIPARYVRLTEHEAKLKYYDYYNGTGRPLVYSTSIEAALQDGGMPFDGFDPGPLMDAFPYDLWGL